MSCEEKHGESDSKTECSDCVLSRNEDCTGFGWLGMYDQFPEGCPAFKPKPSLSKALFEVLAMTALLPLPLAILAMAFILIPPISLVISVVGLAVFLLFIASWLAPTAAICSVFFKDSSKTEELFEGFQTFTGISKYYGVWCCFTFPVFSETLTLVKRVWKAYIEQLSTLKEAF